MHWICRWLIISRETSLCINLHRRGPLGKGGNLELLTALKRRATARGPRDTAYTRSEAERGIQALIAT